MYKNIAQSVSKYNNLFKVCLIHIKDIGSHTYIITRKLELWFKYEIKNL
jgi:hypothetical protein